MLRHIQQKVKPTTKVSSSNLKAGMEKADLPSFNFDFAKLLSFFLKTKKSIRFDIGDRHYDEYVRLFFQSLEAAPNADFKLLVNTERNAWEGGVDTTLERLGATLLRKYNNLTATGQWNSRKAETKNPLEAKVVALEATVARLNKGKTAPSTSTKNSEQNNFSWRFSNEENSKTLVRDGKTWFWCTKCENRKTGKPGMWTKHKEEEHTGKPAGKKTSTAAPSTLRVNKDLKVAMASAKTEAEVEAVMTQFNLN